MIRIFKAWWNVKAITKPSTGSAFTNGFDNGFS